MEGVGFWLGEDLELEGVGFGVGAGVVAVEGGWLWE